MGLAALIPTLVCTDADNKALFTLCERMLYARVWDALLEQLLPLAVDGMRVPLSTTPGDEFVAYVRVGILKMDMCESAKLLGIHNHYSLRCHRQVTFMSNRRRQGDRRPRFRAEDDDAGGGGVSGDGDGDGGVSDGDGGSDADGAEGDGAADGPVDNRATAAEVKARFVYCKVRVMRAMP
jgi:hypothetical protein